MRGKNVGFRAGLEASYAERQVDRRDIVRNKIVQNFNAFKWRARVLDQLSGLLGKLR